MAEEFNPQEESQGFGDTIAKITHATGLDKVAEGVAKLMGKEDCGCNRRRQALNEIFPYKNNTPEPIPTPVDPSLYNFEGERTFRVLTGFSANVSGTQFSHSAGEEVIVTNKSPMYAVLRSLLQQHTIELIPNK